METPGVSAHAIPMVAQRLVFLFRRRDPVIQQLEVFIPFRPPIGGGQGNRHAGVA